MNDQVDEAATLSPVQIFLKEEEGAYCKAEEPVLVSLVPVLLKEEHVLDESPEDFEVGSHPLLINLDDCNFFQRLGKFENTCCKSTCLQRRKESLYSRQWMSF
ncbi:uncharacterized protein LOC124553922 [Schistocerca americana]|uniref:uncharacterized protein LOC124553909 n=1 Tax=Schistocerca americana TaxID=7009 RepID=UPI001F4FA899|nr:uncharacterized protein LOC124553909 [Schistocerca americana]XP_046983893.1 uncharacterized protein LOC124553916 [Schistocerca americana]XP_046983903.1 uncharacterized protein LOC124553922 [Schistocerca americana]